MSRTTSFYCEVTSANLHPVHVYNVYGGLVESMMVVASRSGGQSVVTTDWWQSHFDLPSPDRNDTHFSMCTWFAR